MCNFLVHYKITADFETKCKINVICFLYDEANLWRELGIIQGKATC